MHIRYTLLAVPLLAMAALGQDAGFSGTERFHERPAYDVRPIIGAPYSAEQTLTLVQTFADGTHITKLNNTCKMYRDSQGRMRFERAAVDNRTGPQLSDKAPVIVEITDTVEHVQYTLDPVNKVAHKQALRPEPNPNQPTLTRRSTPGVAGWIVTFGPKVAPAPVQASSDNGSTITREELGKRTIEGVEVEGTRLTTVWPGGSVDNDQPSTVVSEHWRSPELKIMVLGSDSDPRRGESTCKLSNISRDEPDLSLFAPPPDYSVVEEKGGFTISWGPQAK